MTRDHHPEFEAPAAATGASQLADVLAAAELDGFVTEFDVGSDEARNDVLRCPECRTEQPAASFERTWSARLEGASDPADMLQVSALTCPHCAARGVFVSPFGPAASPRQASVLTSLPAPSGERPPSPPAA